MSWFFLLSKHAFQRFQVAISAALTLWSIQEENFSNSYPYCSSGSTITIARLSTIHYALCAICAASLFGILGLRIYNKYALDRYVLNFLCLCFVVIPNDPRKTFSLGDSFHLRENQHIIQLLCPLAIFQAVFLLFFVAGGAVVPSFRHNMELIIFRTIFAAFYVSFYDLRVHTYVHLRQRNRIHNVATLAHSLLHRDNSSNHPADHPKGEAYQ